MIEKSSTEALLEWTTETLAKLNAHNRVRRKPRCAEVNALSGLIYYFKMK